MSLTWYKASLMVPPKSDRYMVCFNGVYYLADYNAASNQFHMEVDAGKKQVIEGTENVYWAELKHKASATSILVVDDDPNDLDDLVSAVKELNPTSSIDTAQNGVQALYHLKLRTLANDFPEIILLDLYMPECDGFTVLQSLRASEEFRQTRIYAITSSFSRDDWSRAKNLGANDVFHKNQVKVEFARILGSGEAASSE